MIDQQKLYSIWVYLQAEPLFWLTLTIGSYIISDSIYRRTNLFPLLNPVAISVLLVSLILISFDIKYERYFEGAKFIHFLLGPVTVALAIPIYRKWHLIILNSKAIFISLIIGSVFAILVTYILSLQFEIQKELILSLLPRSVTAPIAMGISEIIGGIPSLTAIITIITGVIGASLGVFVFDLIKLKKMEARGFSLGLASHGIGTARAMSRDKNAGVFAAVGMGLSGLTTSILVPLFLKIVM
ncbi:MAG: LrgB family protein [Candidatus Puniceispirillales bacterium]|jgi:predicted murein hydrolase (TIGR00659 family)|nr:LrgB family protein [Alphaproteobacteria bacterium]MBL6850368.1 LrgB family protein [Alphaproteobacteria bacterium]